MSEHGIEELRRQVQQAKSRAQQAERDRREAEFRLNEKRAEASGLIGKVATYRGRSMLVTRLRFWDEQDDRPRQYVGPRILKDGSLGQEIEFFGDDKIEWSDRQPSQPNPGGRDD